MKINYPAYPKQLCGRENFKKIENVELLKRRNFFVSRTTNMDSECFSDEAIVNSFESGCEVKDSTVKNGISVNLIARYKKKHLKFFPIEDKTSPRFHLEFSWNTNGCKPQVGEYSYNHRMKYYGFRISQIHDMEISFAYKANGISPSDKIRVRLEHCPTMSNFWHFNMFLWGKDVNSGKWVKLEIQKHISNGTFKKIAMATFPHLAKKIVIPKMIRARKLNKKYYTK